ncbi:membrane protein YbiO [Escherichia coli]|uniref:Membrane protein YbiO n=1 Tax=Escherichia coli TaxID=562 RepID=A0A376ZR54_ECOLX|nr:membrane protein YbiO [Escherichia coli]
MLLLSAWGLFDFWNWLQNGAGQKTVDILNPHRTHSFLLGGWLDSARQFDRKPAGFGYSWPPATQRPYAYPADAVRNALAVIISTITIMIVLSEIGVNIAPLLAGAGALGLAISFGSQSW